MSQYRAIKQDGTEQSWSAALIVLILVLTFTPSATAGTPSSNCTSKVRKSLKHKEECERTWMDAHLRINQIQVIGSHNSYHLLIDPVVMQHFMRMDSTLAQEVDYASHATLTEQLDMGLRQLEVDVYDDPAGGRYAYPEGEKWIAEAHGTPVPDARSEMLQPGFKVLHMADVDYRSNCQPYVACLKEIRAWSIRHPGHLPIFVHGNAKEPSRNLLHEGAWTQTQSLSFDHAAFSRLNREVLSVFKRSELITPEDVIAGHDGLLAATDDNRWPTLGESRGKVLFVIDGGQKQARVYENGDPTMRGAVYFVDAHDSLAVDAGYTVVLDPRGHVQPTQDLVRRGFLVRTLADFLTVEPRTGDYSRSTAAFASGAQVVSTDYYRPDPRFPFPYRLSGFPGGTWVRCNPLNTTSRCNANLLDPYIHSTDKQ